MVSFLAATFGIESFLVSFFAFFLLSFLDCFFTFFFSSFFFGAGAGGAWTASVSLAPLPLPLPLPSSTVCLRALPACTGADSLSSGLACAAAADAAAAFGPRRAADGTI